jgi:hypothetical protein
MFLYVIGLLLSPSFGPAEPLKLVQTIALEGVEGRIDHLAVDVKGERVFVAALGNNSLEIIDLRAGKRIHSITGLHEPQGVAYLPDSNRIAVANGQGEGIDLYDGATYKLAGRVKLGDDSDNVRYDQKEQRIYVGFGAGAIAVIDARTLNVLAKIPLPAHPESFQLSKSGPSIWINIPHANQIAVIDRQKRTVAQTWKEYHARSNYPMTLDEADGCLFAGFRDPPIVQRRSLSDGHLTTILKIAGDTDDMFFDHKRNRLYVVCGEGFIESFGMVNADKPGELNRVSTHAGARTGLFVPQLDRLCLAVPHRGNGHAEIRVYMPQ